MNNLHLKQLIVRCA